jgi:HD-GYP domain-containing protein (c-di-GMP phosphodiesterase class II)
MGTAKVEPGSTEERWQARPILSVVLRVVATLAPAAVALAFSVVASHVVAPPPGTGPRIAWWLGISVLSLAVLFGVQRMARRLLPLAALLKLSLVFPDAAPARYKLARKVGRPKDLERLVERARAAGLEGGEILAPQTVLELVAALSVHDRATRGHSERVRIFADMIATELKLPQHDQDRLRWGGPPP